MEIFGTDFCIKTGAGTSMSKLGWADLGMATLNDMQNNAAIISSLDPSCPVIADADTGYGGPVMVSRTVAQYSRSGVAALHIEDQVSKRKEKEIGNHLTIIGPRETVWPPTWEANRGP